MLTTGFQLNQPAAVRYPRGRGPGVAVSGSLDALPVGRAEVRRQGKGVALLAFGSMLGPALAAAESLGATVVSMRFVKPLDETLLVELAEAHELLVTVEENVVAGGAGSAVSESLASRGIATAVLHLGLPDAFVPHGDRDELLSACELDAAGILSRVRRRLRQSADAQEASVLPLRPG